MAPQEGWILFGINILIPYLVKEYNLYAYETETGHRQKIPFKDYNFILSSRKINDHTPAQNMHIMDIDLLGNKYVSDHKY